MAKETQWNMKGMHSNSVLFWVIKCQKFTLFPTGIPTLCKMYRTKDCRINKGVQIKRGKGGRYRKCYTFYIWIKLSLQLQIHHVIFHTSYLTCLHLSSLSGTVLGHSTPIGWASHCMILAIMFTGVPDM